MRRVVGIKREFVLGRRRQREELDVLRRCSNEGRSDRCACVCVRRGKCIRIVVGKSKVKGLVVRYRLRGTILLKLISRKQNEIGWSRLIWLRVGTVQDFVWTVMNVWVPQETGKFLKGFDDVV
jgi:hypothetical protein